MERNQSLFEDIEAYLSGQMENNRLKVFESELLSNPELAEEVEKHKILHNELSKSPTLEFESMLEEVKTEFNQKKSISFSKRINASKYWQLAAIFILVFGSVIIWLYSKTNISPQELYADNFITYPMKSKQRGGTEIDVLRQIRTIYKKNNFDKAAKELEIIIEKHPTDYSLMINLACCYMHTNREKKAIEVLNNIQTEGTLDEVTNWYLGLSYLKLNEFENAQKHFREVIEFNGVYKEKASQISIELNKIKKQ